MHHYLIGDKHREIAQVVGLTEKTITNKISILKEKLNYALEKGLIL